MFEKIKRVFTRKDDDLKESIRILFGEYEVNEKGQKIAIKTKKVICPNDHVYVVEHGSEYPEECRECGSKEIHMPPVCVVMHPYDVDENNNVIRVD